jgi:hypothetical protein
MCKGQKNKLTDGRGKGGIIVYREATIVNEDVVVSAGTI